MAYQTGTAASIANLLDLLETFVDGMGGTIHRRDASSLSIQIGDLFQNYFDAVSELRMRPSTSFSTGSAWDAQPGAAPYTQIAQHMSGALAGYHFFGGADYIHIVVETDPGVYRHLASGVLDKSSAYSGGMYSGSVAYEVGFNNDNLIAGLFGAVEGVGTISNFYPVVYIDVDGAAAWRALRNYAHSDIYVAHALSTDSAIRGVFSISSEFMLYRDFFVASPNTLNGVTSFIPLHLFASRPGSMRSPVGAVKDLRALNIQNHNPADTVGIGTDEWLVFPAGRKATTGLNATGNYGYAYRKVA